MGNSPSTVSTASLATGVVAGSGIIGATRAARVEAVDNINNNVQDRSNSDSRIKGAIDLIAKDKDETYSIRILPKTTIEHVKVILEAQHGLEMDHKYLKYNKQMMKDGKTLADYSMRSGDTIIIASCEKDDSSPELGLYDASLKGNSEKVRSYLTGGTSARSSDKSIEERMPLHAAAEIGHEEIARLLLRREADVNARDIDGLTPIHIAALSGHVDVFRLLLNGGANLNIKARGMKVIHFAAIGGQVHLLQVLEAICELTEKTDSGLTPLHLAAKHRKLETVIWLVEQGVNFNLRDDRGNTAEDLAREQGWDEIVTYLHHWVLLQQRKFLQVVAQGKLASVKSFIKAGIDVDCQTQEEDEWGHRAIHLASLFGHVDVVTYLLRGGARREAEDDMGSTAMHYAAAGGQIEVMQILKNNWCKLNVCNNLNMTPLHFAAIRGSAKAARWLLAEGVLGSVKSNTGSSAADIAKMEGYSDLSEHLEKQCVKDHPQDKKGVVTLKRELGAGGFGKVYLGVLNGREIVVKEIRCSSKAEKGLISDESEWQILKKLKHPNIVSYVGCIVSEDTLSILMEYCSGGDLAQRIKQQKKKHFPFQEKLVLNWASKIASALNYIHRNKILHRDLKPQNIFLSGSEAIKLGDFGLAKLLEENKFANSYVGSNGYMSPEVSLQLPYNEKCDMWSFGCILYELASFQTDFLKFKESNISNTFNSGYKKLVSSLLNKEPENRPNSSQVNNLPLFKTGRTTSLYEEQFQQQMKEALEDIGKKTNNLMKLVLSH